MSFEEVEPTGPEFPGSAVKEGATGRNSKVGFLRRERYP